MNPYKILFIDNDPREFERFKLLPFGDKHKGETLFLQDPVDLRQVIADHQDLRLIILDMLWPMVADQEEVPLGIKAMRVLEKEAPDIPVIIYSGLDSEDLLELVAEALRLGAHAWISKTETRLLRSFRFERAYELGRKPKQPGLAILHPDQRSRSGVHVAVMFLDMSGFTALTNQVGATEVVKILEEFYRLIAAEVEAHQGYVDKYIGDAVMAVFGAEASAPDPLNSHVSLAIQAARAAMVQSAPFRLKKVEPVLQKAALQGTPAELARIGLFRVGLESGPVEIARFPRGNESELTFIGTPVNIASRLLGHAQPNEFWIGVNAHQTGAVAGNVASDKSFEHKNLPGTFQGYQVRL